MAVIVPTGSRWPPIHHLPEEILLDIFRFSISQDTPLGDLVKLTWVCRHWRIVLEEAPKIWSRISAADGLPHIRKGLRLAQNVPLDIVHELGKSNVDADMFLDEVGGSISRWRSFRFWVTSGGGSFGTLGTKPAPKLVALQLDGGGAEGGFREPVTLFGGAPASSELKEFTVSYIPVVLPPLRLSDLRSLTLCQVPGVSTSLIFQILGESPALEVLRLQALQDLQEAQAHQVETHLTFLQDLLLQHVPFLFSRLLLSTFYIPNLRKLTISSGVGSLPASEILTPDIPRLISVITAITACVPEITIVFDLLSCSVNVGGLSVCTLMTEVEHLHVHDTVHWIRNRLGGHLKDAPGHLSLGYVALSPEFSPVEGLNFGTRVTKLSLRTPPYHEIDSAMSNLIQLLSRPAASWPHRWVLPHLEVFDLNQVFSPSNSNIVDMVRNRQVASRICEGQEIGSAAPSRLREIRFSFEGMPAISSPDAESIRALVEAADGAAVYWHGMKWTGDAMSGGSGSSN